MAAIVGVRLKADERYRADSPITIVCEFSNRSDHPIWVLKWFTPFETLASECLVVSKDGVVLEYDGPLVRRGTARPDDYETIKPRSTIATSVDLRLSYDFSTSGEVTVQMRSRLIVLTRAPLGGQPDFDRDGFDVESAPSTFLVEGSDAQTAGRSARAASEAVFLPVPPTVMGSPLPPNFIGGDAEQQAATAAAHDAGFGLCEAALSGLANDPHYVEFFGAFDNTRFATVSSVFGKVQNRMQHSAFRYDLTGDKCDPSWMAFTHRGSDKITMCPLFWQANPTGVGSQAGTILHEHSHCDAGTSDIAAGSGIDGARFLASNRPGDAVQNADNYESFVETL